MAKNVTPWSEVRAKVLAEPGAAEEIEREKRKMLTAVRLAELRRSRKITQAALAELLKIDQSAVSQTEHRADMTISTLNGYISALGGKLNISATFDDIEIPIAI